jgi:hypothetical protein
MSPKPLTAPGRLQLLLPWLNGNLDEDVYRPGDRPEDVATWTDFEAVRQGLDAFVKSFDGSAGAGFLVAEPDDAAAALDDDAIGSLGALLTILLEQGFGEPTLVDLAVPVASLRVAVRSAGRRKPEWRTSVNGRRVLAGGEKALRDYHAAGAYRLRVQGPTGELVPFLVAHLLTQTEMVAVRRCARRDQPPAADCPHFFIVAPGARGQPKRFCSRSCGLRYAEQSPQRRQK